MPKISQIEPQKKKKDRYNIYLDGKFALGINSQLLLTYKLKIGQNLNDSEIKKIQSEEISAKLLDKALNFLSFRPRSEKEVRDFLAKKISKNENIPFGEAKESFAAESVTSKLKKYKYLNDKEFAAWWLSSRNRSNPRGRSLTKLELARKGIDKNIVESLIANGPQENVLAQRALAKKLKSWQKLGPLELKKKVYQYLGSRGFTFEIIKETFANIAKKR